MRHLFGTKMVVVSTKMRMKMVVRMKTVMEVIVVSMTLRVKMVVRMNMMMVKEKGIVGWMVMMIHIVVVKN